MARDRDRSGLSSPAREGSPSEGRENRPLRVVTTLDPVAPHCEATVEVVDDDLLPPGEVVVLDLYKRESLAIRSLAT